MAKYRKKPIVIEAERWSRPDWKGSVTTNEPDSLGVVARYDSRLPATYPYCFVIQTPEGEMEVSSGDWIITGIKGEKYSCKPDIFEATYEPAAEPIETIDNVRWLKDEWGDYWVAELFHNGTRVGLTGSYYSLNAEGTRASREEQEAGIADKFGAAPIFDIGKLGILLACKSGFDAILTAIRYKEFAQASDLAQGNKDFCERRLAALPDVAAALKE